MKIETREMLEDLESRRARSREKDRAKFFAQAGMNLIDADDMQAASEAMAKAAATLALLAQLDRPASPE